MSTNPAALPPRRPSSSATSNHPSPVPPPGLEIGSPMLGPDSGRGPMSPHEVRGGIANMELLRHQNNQLQSENEELKRLLTQSERDRAQDVTYMRALLSRRLCRQHAQSYKLRRQLIYLHSLVLSMARTINNEQRTSEINENLVLSVQDNGKSHDEAEAEQRAAFLVSLRGLRPVRVGRALQENLERLFEEMNEIVRRGPKYRLELNNAFSRAIELKEMLLAAEAKGDKSRMKAEMLEQTMSRMEEESAHYRKTHDLQTRDMQLQIDFEKRRRMKENSQYIRGRTTLYKQILSDKDSPLHPINLAKIGKPGTNVLSALSNGITTPTSPSNLPKHAKSNSVPPLGSYQEKEYQESMAATQAAQRAYYLERKAARALAAAQADPDYAAMNAEEQKKAFEEYFDQSISSVDQQQVADEYSNDEFEQKQEVDPFSKAQSLTSLPVIDTDDASPSADHARNTSVDEDANYLASSPTNSSAGADGPALPEEFKDNTHSLGSSPATDSSPSSQSNAVNFPPIDGGKRDSTSLNRKKSLRNSSSTPTLAAKLAYSNPFFSPLRPKPSGSYTNVAKAEASYKNSNEWIQKATAAQQQQTSPPMPTAKADRIRKENIEVFERSPEVIKRELLHPAHSPSYKSAQKTYGAPIIGGSSGSTTIIDPKGWNNNFNSKDSLPTSPVAGSTTFDAQKRHQALKNASHALELARITSISSASTSIVDDRLSQSSNVDHKPSGTYTTTTKPKKKSSPPKVREELPTIEVDANAYDEPVSITSPSNAYADPYVPDTSYMSTSEWVESMLNDSNQKDSVTTTTTTTTTTSTLRFQPTSTAASTSVSFKASKGANGGSVISANCKKRNKQSTPTVADESESSYTLEEPLPSGRFARTIPISPRLDEGLF